jgi:hypothetical protein
MSHSISSVGSSHKQKGAGGDRKNQPGTNPDQRLSDQQPPKPEKGDAQGGAEQGSRSVR